MVLESIWFFLWGLLWAIFFITDGFDFGVGTLYPILGKTDRDKRIMLNSVGPVWDGNEVWLITAGGVTFAAFPKVYAVMFSSLYSALMLILFALILRGVAFEFRSKSDNPQWKTVWDLCIFVGGFAPAVLFGVAFANIFQGIPIDGDGINRGTFFSLLNPYGLLGGVLFLLLFMQHGALWIAAKTEGDLHNRANTAANVLWPVVLCAIIGFLIASAHYTALYDNYVDHPILFAIILLAALALVAVKYFLIRQQHFKAWFASAVGIAGATFFGIAGLFPTLFPSSLDTAFSLTAHNASSSPLTLTIMLVVVAIFIPIVIGYQIWAYRLFKDKIGDADLSYEDAY